MNIHNLANTCPQSRLLIVEWIQLQGWPVVKAAEAAGISIRTVYKWLARFRAEGVGGLLDRPSCPHLRPPRTPKHFRRRMEQLRVEHIRTRRYRPENHRSTDFRRGMSSVMRIHTGR